MKTQVNSVTSYLGSRLIAAVYLSLSEETYKVWVESTSFSIIILKLAT